MKRIWFWFAGCLLAIPLVLCVWGFVLPPQYRETFLGELSVKCERLAEPSDKPRLVLVGGSAAAFGVDSALLEEQLPQDRVVNFGMYAALGTRVMLDLSEPLLQEGDLVLVMPEQQQQTLSDYLGAQALWQAADGNFSLLRCLHGQDAAQMLGAADPSALTELNRAIAEAFTAGQDTAPHIRRYYDNLAEQTAKELAV